MNKHQLLFGCVAALAASVALAATFDEAAYGAVRPVVGSNKEGGAVFML